jgi:hypothetical protein
LEWRLESCPGANVARYSTATIFSLRAQELSNNIDALSIGEWTLIKPLPIAVERVIGLEAASLG